MIPTNEVLSANELNLPDGAQWIRGTYAHGDLERDLGYDIFYLAKAIELKPGIHLFKWGGRSCMLYLWQYDCYGVKYNWRGLLVYADDIKALEYCEKCYNDKIMHI